MGLREVILCGLLKSREAKRYIEKIELDGDRITVVARIPPQYLGYVKKCLREAMGHA